MTSILVQRAIEAIRHLHVNYTDIRGISPSRLVRILMKRLFVVFLVAGLLAVCISGHGIAQVRVTTDMIYRERQRLVEEKAKLETTLLSLKGDRYKQAQERWDRVAAVQKKIDDLDRDPEYYFNKR